MKIQVRCSPARPGKNWYFRIVGSNNKVYLTSETYLHKGNAKRAAVDFKRRFLNVRPEIEVQQ
jgi:hypothetical protein